MRKVEQAFGTGPGGGYSDGFERSSFATAANARCATGTGQTLDEALATAGAGFARLP
ncbi:MAG: hypothetical protein OXL68_02385 [Paracoccaceae bacterium]|nr:hypothetical protein [Paracoccaceae bacterium]